MIARIYLNTCILNGKNRYYTNKKIKQNQFNFLQFTYREWNEARACNVSCIFNSVEALILNWTVAYILNLFH